MLNLLVAVEHSLESSFALRTVCQLGGQIRIQPIYACDPPGRDITLGAGWAWKSWEQEIRQQAKSYIEELVQAERSQCGNIEDPVIAMGDPIHKLTDYFWQGSFDLLVIGAPFKELGPLALSRRLWQAARKARQELPLLGVRHLKNIRRAVALTDGSTLAEKALDRLIRLAPFLKCEISLVGLPRDGDSSEKAEALNLEQALAILAEKGIDAAGRTASSISAEQLSSDLKAADLVVSPFLSDDYHSHLLGLSDQDLEAVLFYLGQE